MLITGNAFTWMVCVAVPVQPATTNVYVIVWLPGPATKGLNVDPLTPGPLKVPPLGLAVRFLFEEFIHISVFGLVNEGVGALGSLKLALPFTIAEHPEPTESVIFE